MYKEIFQIRGILKNNNINGYCVYLVNSGFGDILTNASAQSFICDLFDLKFQGIANKDIKTSFTFNNWYNSIIEDAGFCTYHNLKKLLIIEVDDILKDIVYIKSKINMMLENGGGYEAICIKPKSLFFTQSFDEICNDLECSIYDNSFIKIFKNRINQYFANKKYDKSDDSFKICLHLRRGDCSTILVNKNKDIITTSWFSRGVHTHSWYNLKDKSGSRHCLIDFNMLNNMINFAKSMHEKYGKKISITFITDGFDTRMYNIINSDNFKIELKKLGKFVDINVVRNYCNSELDKISNCIFFDKKIVGESKEIFLETIYHILNSNLIISSSRSFIFRVLLGWKDTNLFQIAYLGSIEKTADLHLSKRNVKVYKFKNFNDILENTEISNMIFDTAQENKNQIDINKFNTISLRNIKSKNQKLQKINADLYFTLTYGTAKSRIKNQLTYKLGEAMIANSKSIWGYIRMPYILSYIKETHQKEQKLYQEKIKANPSLKLPPLESYPDYNEAIKIKEHLSYKLGEALINADKSKLKLGYLTLWFKCKNITKEHKDNHQIIKTTP